MPTIPTAKCAAKAKAASKAAVKPKAVSRKPGSRSGSNAAAAAAKAKASPKTKAKAKAKSKGKESSKPLKEVSWPGIEPPFYCKCLTCPPQKFQLHLYVDGIFVGSVCWFGVGNNSEDGYYHNLTLMATVLQLRATCLTPATVSTAESISKRWPSMEIVRLLDVRVGKRVTDWISRGWHQQVCLGQFWVKFIEPILLQSQQLLNTWGPTTCPAQIHWQGHDPLLHSGIRDAFSCKKASAMIARFMAGALAGRWVLISPNIPKLASTWCIAYNILQPILSKPLSVRMKLWTKWLNELNTSSESLGSGLIWLRSWFLWLSFICHSSNPGEDSFRDIYNCLHWENYEQEQWLKLQTKPASACVWHYIEGPPVRHLGRNTRKTNSVVWQGFRVYIFKFLLLLVRHLFLLASCYY